MLILIIALIFLILRAGFRPLYEAIDALNSLSNGNTNVDIRVKGNDEVSKIARSVKSFKDTLINYGKVREKTQKDREDQENIIIKLLKFFLKN